jgi:mevalonate kinase
MLKESLYYSKILLFGEYGIIHDSMGLSIPYNDYNGKLLFSTNHNATSSDSNQKLEKFLTHLEGLESKGSLPCTLNLKKFRSDLDQGMHFDSSIPQGFGVGSSGAIVAAIYDNYSLDKITSDANMSNEKFIELKKNIWNFRVLLPR